MKDRRKGMNNMNYYLVTTKCGHVGKMHYMPITFPIRAESGKEAARIARMIPRVKHHHKDAIISCVRVDKNQYDQQVKTNLVDPYLLSKSKKEQKDSVKNLQERIVKDNHQEELSKVLRKTRPNLKFQKLKYLDLYDDEEEEVIIID